MLSTASVADFQESVQSISEAAARDVAAVWDSWSWDDPFSVRGAASLVVPDVVWTYGDVAAGFAADQYDEWRELERVPGRFVASPAALAVEDQVLAGVRNAVGSLFGSDPDVAAAKTLLSGSVARHVMHGATDTVVDATAADPQAVGWSRRARSSACKFCRMLAGRGAVFRSERTARFASHDRCGCVAAPSWDRDAPDMPAVAYVASQREKSDTDRARIAEFLASMD